jgi:hypothetical protein
LELLINRGNDEEYGIEDYFRYQVEHTSRSNPASDLVELILSVQPAGILGDAGEVEVLVTSAAIVLSDRSDLGQLWRALRLKIDALIGSELLDTAYELACGAAIITEAIMAVSGHSDRTGSLDLPEQLVDLWNAAYPSVHKAFGEQSEGANSRSNLQEMLPHPRRIVATRDLWMTWSD